MSTRRAKPVERRSKVEAAPSEGSGIDFPTAIPAVPRAAWPATCDLLVRIALDSARRGDVDLARGAASDAFVMVVTLSQSDSRACRSIAAGAALTLGEAFLLTGDMARAEVCFDGAARFFDVARDRARAQEARSGIARALGARIQPAALES